MNKIVIVGGGQAALSLATQLRKREFGGSIAILCKESYPPYQRPPLSKKYLIGEMSLPRLYLKPESFYRDNKIDLYLGTTATKIDRKRKQVHFENTVLEYDALALTLGSKPRLLSKSIGGRLKKVFTLRDLSDVDKLAPELKPKRSTLIIGGGYIGLEAAAVAAQIGLKVTLVEVADRILQRVAAPQTSDYFRELHQSQGVVIKEGVNLQRLVGKKGIVTSAKLSDGTVLDIDFAIVGVGIAPVTDIARESGLKVSDGVAVNNKGQTSDAAIWAAGDCCSFPYKGKRIRLESVPHAIEQGQLVADNILGSRISYVPKPWFWSDQYHVKLQITGLNSGFNRVITRRVNETAVSFWYYKDHQLIAVDAINDPRAYMVGKRLIDEEKTARPEIIEDVSSDLKSLLKA